MSLFSKYRPSGYQFYNPERFTNDEARINRINAELQKNLLFQQKYESLFPDNNSGTVISGRRRDEGAKTGRPKAGMTTAALLDQLDEKDFANPQVRTAYRNLRAQQNAQRARSANQRNEQKVKASGSDKRQYNPTGNDFASTIYGTLAKLTNWTNVTGNGHHFQRAFQHMHHVVPCIDRNIRRQVMFAKNKAGKGYHTPKRRNWSSGVPC